MDGYHIKTFREHYCCYKDIVVFKHQYIITPMVSKADAIVAVAKKLTQVIQDKTSTKIGVTEKQQLMQLAVIFN